MFYSWLQVIWREAWKRTPTVIYKFTSSYIRESRSSLSWIIDIKAKENPPIHWLLYKGALLTQDMKKKPTTGNTALGETVIFTQQTHTKTYYLFIKQLNKIDPYHWPFPMSVFKPRVTVGAEWFIPSSFTGTSETSPFQKHCSNPRILETWENSSFHLVNDFRNVSRKQALWFQPGWQPSWLQSLALTVNMDSSWHSDSFKAISHRSVDGFCLWWKLVLPKC